MRFLKLPSLFLLLLLSACLRSAPTLPETPVEADTYIEDIEPAEPVGEGLQTLAVPGTGPWYKADLHTHSVISSEAGADLGVMSEAAKSAGYNALFVTDHNDASSFSISNLNANRMIFEDTYTRWETGAFGSPSETVNALTSTPVNSGAKSLHLASTSSAYAESFIATKRGPNFRSGDVILKVSIFPQRIDPGSSVFVSASVGGDATVDTPFGYTTTDGTVRRGKSTVLVWRLGNGAAPPSSANTKIITYDLGSYTLNAWNTYTINLTDALADIPAADQPVDYNGFAKLKMAVASSGGTADAYFDTYSVNASSPVPPAEEYLYRNSLISTYDTPAFKLFPSIEEGQYKHANRFNFDISSPSEFVSYRNGVDSIGPTQATGYPAQLNHPGAGGGVSSAEAVSNRGYGADQMEVNDDGQIGIWDDILVQDMLLLGTRTTDKHTATYASSSHATYIYAPALEFDTLIRSLFEGKTFLGTSFVGPLVFNLEPSSSLPYPARYPVFVSDALASADVSLSIQSGASDGYTVNWVSEDARVATDTVTSSSFKGTRAISLAGPKTYVRTELRTSRGSVRALSQPIFFYDVIGLPVDKTIHVNTVTTANGQGYTRNMVQGLAKVTWDNPAQRMNLTLTNPAGALVDMRGASSDGQPSAFEVGGSPVAPASSPGAFKAATGSSWFYDAPAHTLYLKVLHNATTENASLVFSGGTSDRVPPTAPTKLTATALTHGQVDLSWTAATDDVGVAGHEIFRDGSSLAKIGNVTSYADTSVQTGATYSYQVRARDAAGNWSPLGNTASATTFAENTRMFAPTADAYVRADYPAKNYGGSSSLGIDDSPKIQTLMKFDVSGIGGKRVLSATLRLYNTNASVLGGDFYRVSDNSWSETGVTWNTAPGADAAPFASLARVASGNWYEVDVSSVVTGDGPLSLKIASASSDGAYYSSKEGTNRPELIITTSDGGQGNGAPVANPQSVSTPQGAPVTITLRGSDADGDCPLAFSVVNRPSHGTLGSIGNVQCGSGSGSAKVVYTPSAAFSGKDSFTFSVTDPAGATSSPVAVSITVAPAQVSTDLTFAPTADAYVRADYPARNYGGSSSLGVDASPQINTLMRFDVSGIGSKRVLSATLRLYNTNSSALGGDFYRVSDSGWNETSVTWNTAPPSDATQLASLGRVAAGNWYEIDVSSLITGDGTVSLSISSTSSDGAYYGSREGSNPPELVVTVE